MNFKERVREEANSRLEVCNTPCSECNPIKEAYKLGAFAGYRKACEKLKEPDCQLRARTGRTWADWLLEKAGMDER